MEEAAPDQGGVPQGSPPPRVPRGLPAALLRYLEARGVLVSIEAQEAFQQMVGVIVAGVIAAALAFAGWLMLVTGAIWMLAKMTGWEWQKLAVAAGGVHVVVALFFLGIMMRRLSHGRWFEHTMNEFSKDRAWLANLDDRH